MGIIVEEMGRYDPYTDKFIKNSTTDKIEVGTDGNLYKVSVSNDNGFLSKDKLYTTADMVAILEDLKREMNPIKECEYQIYGTESWNFVGRCQDVIQQKIDELKGGGNMSSISATQYGQIIEDVKEHTDQGTEQTEEE